MNEHIGNENVSITTGNHIISNIAPTNAKL